MTWIGSVMVLIHAGVHFNTILPWLAVAGMLINVISGLTGKFLLERFRRHLAEAREQFQLRGRSNAEIEQEDTTTCSGHARCRRHAKVRAATIDAARGVEPPLTADRS